jgi:nucleoside-diphosphate-sugar epimerase
MTRKKLIVTGALGVVGRAVVERLARRDGIEVVALARRAPDAGLVDSLRGVGRPVAWLRCDLQDADATRAALAPHRDATHLVYAALHEKPELVRGWLDPDQVARNVAMLRHTLAALEDAPLAHVSLLQGTKAYGAHAGHAMRVPARERDAIRDPRTFYFPQQDLLEADARRRGFGFTIFRPQIVLGVAVGSAMNPVAALGAYAVILRELGRPLAFPGHPHALVECVDARLVAAAIEWSWEARRAHGEAINLANGDVVVWRTLFERLAAHFAMPLVDEPVRVGLEMPQHASLWRRIAEREGLRIADLESLIGLSWQYADVLWANRSPQPVPSLVSTIKARQLGFGDCIDSEICVVEQLEAMQRLAYLPRA